MSLNPVTLPPGRERLSTNPLPTGLPTLTNTMGTVDVWRFAANDALVPKGINSVAPRCIRPLTAWLARDPCDIEHDVAILDQANFSQTEPEGLDERPVVRVRR